VVFRHQDLSEVATRLAWATVIGAALQLGVQIPVVWQLMDGRWRQAADSIAEPVQRVLTTSLPVIFTRGVVQVSSYVDSYIATWLGTGAVSALANATQLYQLPVALFGMAVSSASLPSMSTAVAASLPDALRARLMAGQETIAALVVPSMVAFLVFGDVMVAMLLEHGRFTHDNTLYVWSILAGSAVGLLATTVGRLYASAFYALGDTRTPTRIAILRVVLVAGLGYLLALPLPRLLGMPQMWGAAGLTVSAGVAGWIEFVLLRRALRTRLGPVTMPASVVGRAWLAAAGAAGLASVLRWAVPQPWIVLRGLVILGTYGTIYLLLAQWAGILATTDLMRRVLRSRG
jgi:putative peptidoglycan lipid II flippase